jgi:hypothetical protein
VLWLVTLHVYLFYPICIVANCCFMCLSMVVYVKNVDTNEDLPVLVDIDFSGFVLEQNQTQLFWLFDKSKKCFGAEYFISAVFGLCIHIANISLLIISYQMSTLYPSPRTFSYKTTWIGIFSPISFMTLGILRSLFSEFRLINSFLLFVLALYTIQIRNLLQYLIVPLFYDLKLQYFTVLKPIIIMLAQGYLIAFWRGALTNQLFLRKLSFYLIGMLLCATGLLKLVYKIVELLHSNAEQNLHTGKTISSDKHLVYLFEKFKTCPEDPTLSLFFHRQFLSHRQECHSVMCPCRIMNSQVNPSTSLTTKASNLLKVSKPTKRVGTSAILSLALFSVRKRLEMRVDKEFSHPNGESKGQSLDAFVMYSIFSILNLGNTKKIIMLINSLARFSDSEKQSIVLSDLISKNASHKKGSPEKRGTVRSSPATISAIFPKYVNNSASLVKAEMRAQMKDPNRRNVKVLVVQAMLTNKLQEYNKGVLLEEWIESYDSNYNTSSPQAALESPVCLHPLIDFMNDLTSISYLLNKALQQKKDLLVDLVSVKPDVICKSKNFVKTCNKVEKKLRKYEGTSLEALDIYYFKIVYYWFYVKEDFAHGIEQFRILSNKKLTRQIGRLFESASNPKSSTAGTAVNPTTPNGTANYRKDRSVVLQVSGEPGSSHQISYVSSTASDLGHNASDLLGKDLNLLLPSSVCAFHSSLFSVDNKLAFADQMVRPLEFYVRESSGSIIPASKIVRINSNISKGLQFVGVVEFSSRDMGAVFSFSRITDSMYMVVDEQQYIIDSCSRSSQLLRDKRNLSILSKSLSAYYTDLCSSKDNATYGHVSAQLFDRPILLSLSLPYTGNVYTFNANMHLHTFTSQYVKHLSIVLSPVGQPLHTHPHPVSSQTDTPRVENLHPLRRSMYNITSAYIHHHDTGIENGIGNQRPEEDLKYAQQATSFKTHGSDVSQSPEGMLSENLVQAVKMLAEEDLGSHIFYQVNSTVIYNFDQLASASVSLEYDYTGLLPNSKPEVHHNNKRSVQHQVVGSKSLVKYFSKVVSEHKPLVELSRFIHHSINFGGIKRITALFVSFFVLLIISMIIVYSRESNILNRFVLVSKDIAMLDTQEYMVWVFHRQLLDINHGRMVKQGILTETSFSHLGYTTITGHAWDIFHDTQFAGQLPPSLIRLLMKYEMSNFKEYHNIKGFMNTTIPILFYNEAENRFYELGMTTMDAVRYVQTMFDRFTQAENGLVYPELSSLTSRRDSPLEEVSRYNFLNPLGYFFHQSKFSLTSVRRRQQCPVQDSRPHDDGDPNTNVRGL